MFPIEIDGEKTFLSTCIEYESIRILYREIYDYGKNLDEETRNAYMLLDKDYDDYKRYESYYYIKKIIINEKNGFITGEFFARQFDDSDKPYFNDRSVPINILSQLIFFIQKLNSPESTITLIHDCIDDNPWKLSINDTNQESLFLLSINEYLPFITYSNYISFRKDDSIKLELILNDNFYIDIIKQVDIDDGTGLGWFIKHKSIINRDLRWFKLSQIESIILNESSLTLTIRNKHNELERVDIFTQQIEYCVPADHYNDIYIGSGYYDPIDYFELFIRILANQNDIKYPSIAIQLEGTEFIRCTRELKPLDWDNCHATNIGI